MKIKANENFNTVAENCHRPWWLGGSFTHNKTTLPTGKRNLGALLRIRWKQRGVKLEMAVGRKMKKVTFLRQELVVQRLSSEVSWKAQKYTRVHAVPWGGTLHWRDQSSLQKTFFIFIRTQGIVMWYIGWWAGTILSLDDTHSRL